MEHCVKGCVKRVKGGVKCCVKGGVISSVMGGEE